MVQRYEPSVLMTKADDGDYVDYENYEILEQQRDDLRDACRVGLSYINAIVCKVPRPILELQEDKELVEAAIKKAQ